MISLILSAVIASQPCLAPPKKPKHKAKHKPPVSCIVPAVPALIMPWPVVPDDLQPIPVPHVYERLPEPQAMPQPTAAPQFIKAWQPFPSFDGFASFSAISVNLTVNRLNTTAVAISVVNTTSIVQTVSNVTISSVDNSHNTNVYLAPSSHEAPELDAGSLAAALTMLACAVAVICGARRV